MRIIHISDIHIWKYTLNPLRLMNKRLAGIASLMLGRARRFRLEHVPELVERVRSLNADHLLITGDLTTTALHSEFRLARAALSAWLGDPARVTILPGNHDRYTLRAHVDRDFERYFGEFSPTVDFPWLRHIDSETAILGLDPSRAAVTARGKLPVHQLIQARELVSGAGQVRRLVVACHYPVVVPAQYQREYAAKRLVNADALAEWLRTIGPHLYCCGHVHAAWAFEPAAVPRQLSLNPGAPLLRDHSGHRPPGFLEIELVGADVTVVHHSWSGQAWQQKQLRHARDFFPALANRSP